ncbi:MAG: OmpH family outer membrane protein [Candidatus Cloacimonadota bacterium]|nr:OmpH family outer membrane protein [Candidatus Cloacimonadota bacterium]
MKKLLLTAIAIVITVSILNAQDKIVYIDSERIMMESQDTQEAQQIYQSEQQEWDAEIAELEEEIDKLNTEYESKKMILTESGKVEAQEKINELLEKRQDKIQEIYGDRGLAMQRNQELLEPILEKLQNVIEEIAIENNYDLVLDVASGSVRYAKPKLDITDTIIEKMNEAVE